MIYYDVTISLACHMWFQSDFIDIVFRLTIDDKQNFTAILPYMRKRASHLYPTNCYWLWVVCWKSAEVV